MDGIALALVVVLSAGCGDDGMPRDGGGRDAPGPQDSAADVPALPDAGPEPDAGPMPEPNVRFLTFNIGNPDTADPHYPLRLRVQSYEDHVAAEVQALGADIVALQEVLPPETCEAFDETDPEGTCYEHATRPTQAQRILGADYSIVCDMRLHVECIGVHTSFGTIDGVPEGGFVLAGAATEPLPLMGCNYLDGSCNDDLCDAESTVSSVMLTTARGPLQLIHLHPNASGYDSAMMLYLGTPCRLMQVEGAFGLPGEGPTLMLGDWNFEPGSIVYPMESDLWDMHVGEGLRFTDHGELDDRGRRVPTIGGRFAVAIDQVVTDFARGRCQVIDDPLIDDGYDFSGLPGGDTFSGRIDHRPVLCDLYWPE